jgi:hypothetical protein
MPKAKEPGLRGDVWIPDTNDLRPSQRTPMEREGEGRNALRYAHGDPAFAERFGPAVDDSPATSPASGRFTAGLPKRPPKAIEGDEESIIQQGQKRQ